MLECPRGSFAEGIPTGGVLDRRRSHGSMALSPIGVSTGQFMKESATSSAISDVPSGEDTLLLPKEPTVACDGRDSDQADIATESEDGGERRCGTWHRGRYCPMRSVAMGS